MSESDFPAMGDPLDPEGRTWQNAQNQIPQGPPTGPPGPPRSNGPDDYPYYRGMSGQRPEHPDASTIFMLGLLGLLLCQIVSPFAWTKGAKAREEARKRGYQEGGILYAGYILGIVGTVFLIISVVVVLLMFATLGSVGWQVQTR